MYPDFKELLSALNEHKVQYLIVGGYAVSLHAQPRATKDLDVLVRPDIANATALYRALPSLARRSMASHRKTLSIQALFSAWERPR